jgi:ATP-dependent 26S proteasome regulatory subunit
MPMSAKEQALFETSIVTIKAQQKQLENLVAPVYPTGTIVAVFEKSAIVDTGNSVYDCERPNGTDQSWIGSTVQLHPKTGQIVKRSPYVRYGQTATITQIEQKLIFLNTGMQGTITTEYSQVPIDTLSVGDHVVLNFSNLVIMKKVEFKSKYAFQVQAPLDWSDIGGCVEAKAELRKVLEFPYTKAAVFDFFKKKRVKGGVLWGRPGMGKTLLGRACAGAIARVHKAESVATGFIYIKGPEVLSKWVGDTEEAIRGLFDHARLHYKHHGYPAVIFIDEVDALLTRRGTRTAAGMEQTVVPQFNAEMDGMEESGAFVLLATNRIDTLDPSILRNGRTDRKFHIEAPTIFTAPEIFEIHMRDVPVANQCSKEQLIEAVNKALFSQTYPLYKLETNKGMRVFTLGDIASGAMIAGLVERATSFAIDRNLDNPTPDGLRDSDFNDALTAIHSEQFGIPHFDELKEYVEDGKYEVTGLATCRSAADIDLPVSKQPETAVAIVPGSALMNAFNKDPKDAN